MFRTTYRICSLGPSEPRVWAEDTGRRADVRCNVDNERQHILDKHLNAPHNAEAPTPGHCIFCAHTAQLHKPETSPETTSTFSLVGRETSTISSLPEVLNHFNSSPCSALRQSFAIARGNTSD